MKHFCLIIRGLLWIRVQLSAKNLPESQTRGKNLVVTFRRPHFLFRGGGRGRFSERLRSPPISCTGCKRCFSAACPSSTPSISDSVSIMVDILMLMFFAIVGLVFLSYIIYLLWWRRCSATRAGQDVCFSSPASLVSIMVTGRGAFVLACYKYKL